MKGLVAGLMVVGLLAVAAPAMAQGCAATNYFCNSGLGDPLSLAASGVLIPFFMAATGDVSILEIASPVGENGQVRTGINPDANTATGNSIHIVFFDATCNRTQSTGLDMSANDLALLDFRGFLAIPAANGLAAIGHLGATAFDLVPLTNPIHTRMYWFNVTAGALRLARVVEPIILDAYDAKQPSEVTVGPTPAPSNQNLFYWSPLRTAATFFAPVDVAPLRTTLHLICPTSSIQGSLSNSTAANSGIFPAFIFPVFQAPANSTRTGFPGSYAASGVPTAVNTSAGTGAIGALHARVYDTNEHFVNDVGVPCSCVTISTLTAISTLYANAAPPPVGVGPDGSYSEIEANGTIDTADSAFTGYKLLTVGAVGTPEFWSRLSNGSRASIAQGNIPQVAGPAPLRDKGR